MAGNIIVIFKEGKDLINSIIKRNCDITFYYNSLIIGYKDSFSKYVEIQIKYEDIIKLEVGAV